MSHNMKRLLIAALCMIVLSSCVKEQFQAAAVKGYWKSTSSVATIVSQKKGVPDTKCYRMFYLDGYGGGVYYGTVFDNPNAYQYWTGGGPKNIKQVIKDNSGTTWYHVGNWDAANLAYVIEDGHLLATNGDAILEIEMDGTSLKGYSKVK